jgi:hypothetical protein
MRRADISKTPFRLAAVVAVGCAVSACANPFADDAPTLSELLGEGWLRFEPEAGSPPERAAAPLYCYGTIGREDCYDAPLPSEERRLVGYQGPPPPARDEL